MERNSNAEYLGDGVYADLEGGTVVLRADSHEEDLKVIYLEPETIKALGKYIEKHVNMRLNIKLAETKIEECKQ